ncbi:OmpA family protein [Steroidobacter cummioxidans]|uniref:OmpA family protein n=1 Tax=Steroidobacter cummioxidans TaxID=1803913 RepID=UPI001379CF60|nr:OmpA family protein [Steroidobacter cummioxidans]
MKRSYYLLSIAAVAGLLTACSSTPPRVEDLEVARAVVPQVEASPRAGVAATNVSDARKALNEANKLADQGANVGDIEFQAQVASRNAQIANEKILTAQAQDEIQKGNAERTQVLADARAAEAKRAEQRANSLEQELSDMRAKKTERGMVLTLGDVLFDTGKATLKPGAYNTIDRLASVLMEAPDRKVVIEGHTDSVGSDEMNQALSERRAAAVQTALMERGVAANQITAVGKGKSMPVASNDNAEGRQRNRRVEMVFSDNRSRVASDVQ